MTLKSDKLNSKGRLKSLCTGANLLLTWPWHTGQEHGVLGILKGGFLGPSTSQVHPSAIDAHHGQREGWWSCLLKA